MQGILFHFKTALSLTSLSRKTSLHRKSLRVEFFSNYSIKKLKFFHCFHCESSTNSPVVIYPVLFEIYSYDLITFESYFKRFMKHIYKIIAE